MCMYVQITMIMYSEKSKLDNLKLYSVPGFLEEICFNSYAGQVWAVIKSEWKHCKNST